MGWFTKKSEIDLDSQLKAFELYEQDISPVKVARQLKIPLSEAKAYEKQWMEEQKELQEKDLELKVIEMLEEKKIHPKKISLKLGIPVDKVKKIYREYQTSMADFDELTKDEKKKKKTDYEQPYRIMKLIRDTKTHRKSKAVYSPEAFDEIPASHLEFISFAEEYGDGKYTVLDNRGITVKSIAVSNLGFDDPADLKEDEEDENYPSPYSRYPYMMPAYPPIPGRGKGKKSKKGEEWMPSFGYDGEFDPVAQMAIEDRQEQMLMTMAEMYIQRGQPAKAEQVLKRLYKLQEGEEETGTEEGKKGFTDWLKEIGDIKEGFDTLAPMLGYSHSGSAEVDKAREYGNIIRETVKTAGDSIVKPILDHIEGEQEWGEELDSLVESDMSQSKQPQLPLGGSTSEHEFLGDIGKNNYESDTENETKTDEFLGEVKDVDFEEMREEDEETSEKEESSMVNPLQKLSFGEKFMARKVIPRWLYAMKNDIEPELVVNEDFGNLTSPLNAALVGKKRMVEAYKAAKQGYQFYLDKYTPIIESTIPLYDDRYNLFVEEGRRGLETKWIPPKGMTIDSAIKILKLYGTLKTFYDKLLTTDGQEWMQKYQNQMVKRFQEHFGHKEQGDIIQHKPVQKVKVDRRKVASPCPHCGKMFKNVPVHIRMSHKELKEESVNEEETITEST